MGKFEELEAAAKESTAKVLSNHMKEQVDNLDANQFKGIITELKKNSVDDKTIEELTAVVGDSTKRNKHIVKYIDMGGKVSEIITKKLQSFIAN